MLPFPHYHLQKTRPQSQSTTMPFTNSAFPPFVPMPQVGNMIAAGAQVLAETIFKHKPNIPSDKKSPPPPTECILSCQLLLEMLADIGNAKSLVKSAIGRKSEAVSCSQWYTSAYCHLYDRVLCTEKIPFPTSYKINPHWIWTTSNHQTQFGPDSAGHGPVNKNVEVYQWHNNNSVKAAPKSPYITQSMSPTELDSSDLTSSGPKSFLDLHPSSPE